MVRACGGRCIKLHALLDEIDTGGRHCLMLMLPFVLLLVVYQLYVHLYSTYQSAFGCQ